MKKQFFMIGIFALSFASGIASADQSDQGATEESTYSPPTPNTQQSAGKFGLTGVSSADPEAVGSVGYNTDDPNVPMYAQGAADDYLVWCEKCGKYVPASAMRLANHTAAPTRVVSRETDGNGDGARQQNGAGER